MVERVLPFLGWFRNYNKQYLTNDFVAGLTVAVVLVPQSMAYAMLAGLPPVHGLYAGAIASAIAALWGSSPQLQTGPVAIVSFLVFTSLMTYAQPESPEFLLLAASLALMAGIFQLFLGIFKLGFIMNFVSHAVVSGFSNAAAIIIASTQVPHLLGIEIEKHEFVFKNFAEIAKNVIYTNPYTAVIGFLSIVLIILLRKIHRAFPSALAVVVLSTLATYYLGLEDKGVKVVGDIPAGLPTPTIPLIDMDMVDELLGKAIVIAIIGFMEAYAIAKTISVQTKHKLDVDQELIGQGLANIAVSFFKGYPVSGSFSRSAVNFLAGAKTGMSSVFTTLFVLITLFFLAPLLYYLPRATLAAIVILAVIGIVKPGRFLSLYKTNKQDGIIAFVTFFSSFIMKPDYAIFIGVVLSLILFLWRSMYPRIVRLSRDPETKTFVNAQVFGIPECPQILFIRPDASLYFANAEHIFEEIEELISKKDKALKYLVIDGESINYMDATAVEVFKDFVEELHRKDIELYLVNIKLPVKEVLYRAGIIGFIGEDKLLSSKGQTIGYLFKKLDHDYCRSHCPYAVFEECSTVKEVVKLKRVGKDFLRKIYEHLNAVPGIEVFIGHRDEKILILVGKRTFEFNIEDFMQDSKGRFFISPTKSVEMGGHIFSIGRVAHEIGLPAVNGYPLLGESISEAADRLRAIVEHALTDSLLES